MNVATLIALTGVASVFVIAGIGKLLAPTSTAEAYRELRMPRLFWGPAAVAGLAVVEIIVGLTLVLAVGSALAIGSRVTALILTIGFFEASIRTVNADRADCGCFGALGSVRTGAPAIIRNGVLLVCSAFLVVASFLDPQSTSHALALPALGVVLGVTIIVRMRPRSRAVVDTVQAPQELSVYVSPTCSGCTTVLTALNDAALSDPTRLGDVKIFAEMRPEAFASRHPALAPYFRHQLNRDRRAAGIARVPAVADAADDDGNVRVGTREVLGAFGLAPMPRQPAGAGGRPVEAARSRPIDEKGL